MERSKTNDNENNDTKNWIFCDFCRTKKNPKFNPKHIEVSNTDAGQFQGPTCYLSVHNTEIIPLSEEKKAALEAEKAKEKKKKKILKAGLSPEEKEKELDDEYKGLLKIATAEDKENRKIALERHRMSPKIKGKSSQWRDQLKNNYPEKWEALLQKERDRDKQRRKEHQERMKNDMDFQKTVRENARLRQVKHRLQKKQASLSKFPNYGSTSDQYIVYELDVSFVFINQIIEILPPPQMKVHGDRLLYSFSLKV